MRHTRATILVCGGRDFDDEILMRDVLLEYYRLLRDVTVIHGDAGWVDKRTGRIVGADKLAGKVAAELGFHVVAVPADWAKDGKAAGPIRNRRMLEMGPQLVVAFPGGAGTADMCRQARKAGVEVREVTT